MSLRKYSGSALDNYSPGIMSLAVYSTPSEYETMNTWLSRNGVVIDVGKTSSTPYDCIIKDGFDFSIKKSYRLYTFYRLKKAILNFRLSFNIASKDPAFTALYSAYCEYVVDQTKAELVPKRYHLDLTFYDELTQWANHSDIECVNLATIAKSSVLPITGRVMFIHYIESSSALMPIILFMTKGDAMLYSLSYKE